jgi:hypothetical protein
MAAFKPLKDGEITIENVVATVNENKIGHSCLKGFPMFLSIFNFMGKITYQ